MLPLRLALIFVIVCKYFVMEALANNKAEEYLTKYCQRVIASKESRTVKSPFKHGKHISERKGKDKDKKKGKVEGEGKDKDKDKDKDKNKDKNKSKDEKNEKTQGTKQPKNSIGSRINVFFPPSDCSSLYYSGVRTSGVYTIFYRPAWLTTLESTVYCDMHSEGGAWTVIQRRGDFGTPHINFTRSWLDYSMGFGNLSEEFWLGNENIHRLTMQDEMLLRVELKDFDGNFRYANYEIFAVMGHKSDYQLQVGNYSGNAGDSMSFHDGQKFVTFDFNDDKFGCAKMHKGGWWYKNCISANLNGVYLEKQVNFHGINWFEWKNDYTSYSWTEMKIRPLYFRPKIPKRKLLTKNETLSLKG